MPAYPIEELLVDLSVADPSTTSGPLWTAVIGTYQGWLTYGPFGP